MTKSNPRRGRVIRLNRGIVGPDQPRLKSVSPKRIGDYPGVAAAHLQVARNYSNPLLMGPPICDQLIELVEHLFTEEEALLVRHIKSPSGKTAAAVAASAGRPVDEVRPILERLNDQKAVLLSFGKGEKKRFGLLPIAPGVFEMVLMRTSLETLTDWHRRFAQLFAALYETGFLADYARHPVPVVRYLPVGKTIQAHPMALPSDRLEEVLDRAEVFAVGLCQCRMTEELVGRGCGRPLENCVGFGRAVKLLIRKGRMRRAEKKEVLEIKAQAETRGLATFMFDTELKGNTVGASCSCCGCCCHALRTISQFNMPGLIAPPHFMPKLELTRCTHCGACSRVCPMGAMVVDTKGKTHKHLRERCIGCGLCAVACDKQQAIQMEPVPKYRKPPRSLLATLLRLAPNHLRNAWSAWRKHR